MDGYLSPSEFRQMMEYNTAGALDYVLNVLHTLSLQMITLQLQIDQEEDEDVIGEWELKMKALRRQETSFHRLLSGIQSRLKVG
jgi:hypothetical protein